VRGKMGVGGQGEREHDEQAGKGGVAGQSGSAIYMMAVCNMAPRLSGKLCAHRSKVGERIAVFGCWSAEGEVKSFVRSGATLRKDNLEFRAPAQSSITKFGPCECEAAERNEKRARERQNE